MTALVLANLEPAAGHGGAAQALRLGPLLALLVVTAWAAAADGRRSVAGAGGAVTFAAAGVVHLALVGRHAADSVAAGVFFAVAGGLELVLAARLWRDPGARAPALSAVAMAGGLLAVYVAGRLWALPLAGGREAVDSLGLVTKALEVTGAVLALAAFSRRRLPWPVPPGVVIAVTALVVAVAARPVVGLGPTLGQVAAAVLTALLVAALAGVRSAKGFAAAVADGALVALLIRADGPTAYLLGGLVAGLLRLLARSPTPLTIAPVAGATLAVLAVPALDARMEILHVGHPGDAVAILATLLVSATVAVAVWRLGRLGAVVGFLTAHLTVQATRVAVGATSLEAAELPATSLGLFLIGSVVLADASLLPTGRAALLVGVLAGLLDGALRATGMPYAPLIAVGASLALTAPLLRERTADQVQAGSPTKP